jgi:hypothetical protein
VRCVYGPPPHSLPPWAGSMAKAGGLKICWSKGGGAGAKGGGRGRGRHHSTAAQVRGLQAAFGEEEGDGGEERMEVADVGAKNERPPPCSSRKQALTEEQRASQAQHLREQCNHLAMAGKQWP